MSCWYLVNGWFHPCVSRSLKIQSHSSFCRHKHHSKVRSEGCLQGISKRDGQVGSRSVDVYATTETLLQPHSWDQVGFLSEPKEVLLWSVVPHEVFQPSTLPSLRRWSLDKDQLLGLSPGTSEEGRAHNSVASSKDFQPCPNIRREGICGQIMLVGFWDTPRKINIEPENDGWVQMIFRISRGENSQVPAVNLLGDIL